MKCNQPRPGFELVSPCPFPTTITITPRAPDDDDDDDDDDCSFMKKGSSRQTTEIATISLRIRSGSRKIAGNYKTLTKLMYHSYDLVMMCPNVNVSPIIKVSPPPLNVKSSTARKVEN